MDRSKQQSIDKYEISLEVINNFFGNQKKRKKEEDLIRKSNKNKSRTIENWYKKEKDKIETKHDEEYTVLISTHDEAIKLAAKNYNDKINASKSKGKTKESNLTEALSKDDQFVSVLISKINGKIGYTKRTLTNKENEFRKILNKIFKFLMLRRSLVQLFAVDSGINDAEIEEMKNLYNEHSVTFSEKIKTFVYKKDKEIISYFEKIEKDIKKLFWWLRVYRKALQFFSYILGLVLIALIIFFGINYISYKRPYNEAIKLMVDKNWKLAIDKLEIVNKRSSEYKNVYNLLNENYMNLGIYYFKEGAWFDATLALEYVISNDTTQFYNTAKIKNLYLSSLLNSGYTRYKHKLFNEAYSFFKKIIQLDSNHKLGWEGVIKTFHRDYGVKYNFTCTISDNKKSRMYINAIHFYYRQYEPKNKNIIKLNIAIFSKKGNVYYHTTDKVYLRVGTKYYKPKRWGGLFEGRKKIEPFKVSYKVIKSGWLEFWDLPWDKIIMEPIKFQWGGSVTEEISIKNIIISY